MASFNRSFFYKATITDICGQTSFLMRDLLFKAGKEHKIRPNTMTVDRQNSIGAISSHPRSHAINLRIHGGIPAACASYPCAWDNNVCFMHLL